MGKFFLADVSYISKSIFNSAYLTLGDSNIYRKVFCLNGREEELVLGQYVDDSIILASSPEAQRWLSLIHI